MKIILLISAALVAFAGTAQACKRGAVEYPEITASLEQSRMAVDKKETLTSLLDRGRAIHQQGEKNNDVSKMRESLSILDQVRDGMKN